MAKEDFLLKLSLLEQEANTLQEQMQLIAHQISEFEILKQSLDEISKTEGKEILANLGRGILFKSEVKEKELFVNVGSGIVLKKKPEEAVGIIDKQIRQLEEARKGLEREMIKINFQFQELIERIEKEKN